MQKSGQLSCAFCGHNLNIQDFAEENGEYEADKAQKKMWMRAGDFREVHEEKTDNFSMNPVVRYCCDNCGAELDL